MLFLLFVLALLHNAEAQCSGLRVFDCQAQFCCTNGLLACEWVCNQASMMICLQRKRLVANLTLALGAQFDEAMGHSIFYSDDPVPPRVAHLSDDIAAVRHQRKRPVPDDGTCRCPGGCCPSDCTVSGWSSWSTCSVTCGSGMRSRSRTKMQRELCGGSCVELTDTEQCNTCCPVACSFGGWAQWSACSATCGGGRRSRSRAQTDAVCGGASCLGSATESEDCATGACPVNCVVSAWSAWGACSVTCGAGTMSRSRTILTPSSGGMACPGLSEELMCSMPACVMGGTPAQPTASMPTAATTSATTQAGAITTQAGVITLPPAGTVSSDSTAATTAATASSGGASSGEQANGAIANQAARTDDMISTSADAFDLAYPLIGAGVGLVVLLLLIALVVVLVRRKKKQRSPHDKQSPDKQPVVPASAPEMGTSTVGTTMYGNVAAVAPSRNIKVGSYQAVSVVSDNTTYSPLDLEKSGTAYMPMEMGGKQTDIGSHY